MHCFNPNATPIRRIFAFTSLLPNNPKMQFAVSFCGGGGSSSSTSFNFLESSSHICGCPPSHFPRNAFPKTGLKWPSLSRRIPSPNARASVSVSDNPQTESGDPPSPAAATATANGPPQDSSSSSSSDTFGNSARRSADWKAARAYHEKSLIYEGRVEDFNTGGLLIRFYSLVGFVPFPQLAPSHTYPGPKKNTQDTARGLVGSVIRVKVIRADEKNRQLIFSEKEAVWCKYSKNLKVGDIFEGKVGSVEEYGAFVHLRFPDGMYHLTGLVHVSEVSWDLVQDCRDILSEGDDVKVKIINIDRRKSRMTLSIKQLEQDPLLETLDKVIPQDGSVGDGNSLQSSDDESSNINPLPGLDEIFRELLKEEGIEDVRINRQGFEKRVVSPDLQLWLSNAPPVDKTFVLLARAGRQVQEIQLTTSLDQQGIKAALQRVLERVP